MCGRSIPGAEQTSGWLFWQVQREALHPGRSWTWRIQHPCIEPTLTKVNKQYSTGFKSGDNKKKKKKKRQLFDFSSVLFYLFSSFVYIQWWAEQLNMSQHVASTSRLNVNEREQFVSNVWILSLTTIYNMIKYLPKLHPCVMNFYRECNESNLL